MHTNRKTRLAALLTYIVHFLAVFVLSLVCLISAATANPEGWDALGIAVLFALSILGAIYAVILLAPLLFSAIAYRRERRGLIVACLPFDILYIFILFPYMLSLFFSAGAAGFLLFPFWALSLTTLILNILILKRKTTPPQVVEATEEGEQQ